MKEFLKMTLATVLGIIIVSFISCLFSLMLLGSIAALGSSKPTMPREAVLEIDFSEISLAEQSRGVNPFSNPMDMLTGSGSSTSAIGLWQAIQAINAAAEDPAVKFIYLKADDFSGGMAALEEFRGALKNFRASGKPVIAWTEMPGNASYYLSSVADKVLMADYIGGEAMITGLASRIIYLKDILDKLGIKMQLIRHGKYKSAGEMYIRNSISEENKLQYQTLLNSIWGHWSREIASSRNITAAKFNALVNGLKLGSPADMLEQGLVDELLDREGLKSRLCDFYGTEKYEKIKSITLSDYAEIKVTPNLKAKQKIAVIYADGQINDGYGSQEVCGDRFASIIADVRKDSTVKAVVLRVNSPGGSVVGSDKILKEINHLRAVKPVVASYGDYAASGGYWISNSCDHIFSDAGTLTGSIGVFGTIPDVSGGLKKVGVNIETVTTNSHGDMYAGTRPLNSAELAYRQKMVDEIYDTFTAIVAEGRDLKQSYVDDIAQGRVWAGEDALRLGLVDEIGGIEDALNYTIGLVDGPAFLQNWNIVEYPKPQSSLEQLMDMFSIKGVKIFDGTPFEGIEKSFADWNKNEGKVYARLPYEISIE